MTVVNGYKCNWCGQDDPEHGVEFDVTERWRLVKCEDSEMHLCDRCGTDIARLFPVPDPRFNEAKWLLESLLPFVGSRLDGGPMPDVYDETKAFLAKPEAPADERTDHA